MASDELKGSRATNWEQDATLMDTLAEISWRLDPYYVPPYKTGEEWLDAFLNRPEAERVGEYELDDLSYGKVRDALKNTVETPLGGAYSRILYERERKMRKYSPGSDFDINRIGRIRDVVEATYQAVRKNVARLKADPGWKYEVDLLSFTAPTHQEANKASYASVSGSELRWFEIEAEDIERQVERSAILNSLKFPFGVNNVVSLGPHFVSGIATDDESTRRTLSLHWGWGNPHVFYGIDVTETDGAEPNVVLADKIVVASAYDIAQHSTFLGSFPQDLVYYVPSPPDSPIVNASYHMKKFA